MQGEALPAAEIDAGWNLEVLKDDWTEQQRHIRHRHHRLLRYPHAPSPASAFCDIVALSWNDTGMATGAVIAVRFGDASPL